MKEQEKSYKVHIKKVHGKHKTQYEATGDALHLPEVGRGFILVGDDMLYTTEVKNVEHMGNEYRFNTENSTYHLEVLNEKA